MKISDLSYRDRQRMVSDISGIMYGYNIHKESIEEFWETIGIGIEVKKRA